MPKKIPLTIESIIGEDIVYIDKKSALLSSIYDVKTFDENTLKNIPEQFLPLEPFFRLAKREGRDLIGLSTEQIRDKYGIEKNIYENLLKEGYLRKAQHVKSLENQYDTSIGNWQKKTIYFPTEIAVKIFLVKRK